MSGLKITLVDAMPFVYSQYAKVGHLSASDGTPTGLRYGFLRAMKSYATKTWADRFVICWDTPQAVEKAEGTATYKANRTLTDNDKRMYAQVPELQEMLELCRWPQAFAPGYESDDIIGTLARRFEADNKITIISTDNDLLQLVGPNTVYWRPPSKKEPKGFYKTPEWVRMEYGVPPQILLYWRALVGDTSDNIQPVLDRTQKPTQDLIKTTLLTVASTTGAARDQPALLDAIMNILGEEQGAQFKANYNLMSLHQVPRERLEIRKGKRDRQTLEALFTRLEFKSMMKDLDTLTSP
jgi:5'-3' exonuclease